MIHDQAVAHNAVGRHREALVLREQRMDAMAVTDPAYPGVLAASALNHERLGECDQAVLRANEALYIRAPAGESVEDSILRAEQLPSVRINAGTVLLRKAARLRLTYPYSTVAQSRQIHADNLLGLAWDGVQAQRTSRIRPHQHHINLLPRMAMKEAVNGKAGKAVGYALGAIALGSLSESPMFVEHTSGLGLRARVVAKMKGVARGMTAFGIAILSLPRLCDAEAVQRRRDRLILAPRTGA